MRSFAWLALLVVLPLDVVAQGRIELGAGAQQLRADGTTSSLGGLRVQGARQFGSAERNVLAAFEYGGFTSGNHDAHLTLNGALQAGPHIRVSLIARAADHDWTTRGPQNAQQLGLRAQTQIRGAAVALRTAAFRSAGSFLTGNGTEQEFAVRLGAGLVHFDFNARLLSADGLRRSWRDTTYMVGGFPFFSRYNALEKVRGNSMDLEAAVLVGRATRLELRGGIRSSSMSAAERWAGANASVPLAGSIRVEGGFSRTPTRLELGMPAYTSLRLGLRYERRTASDPNPERALPASAARTEITPISDGVRVRLVNLPGNVVELMGDPTGWEARALRRTGAGTWECLLPLTSGTYRIAIRVDAGEWRAPPGLPIMRDELGESGVFLVEIR